MKWLYNRLIVLTVVAFPAAVNASMEAQGTISQLFYADDTQCYNSINDIPVDMNYFQIQNPVYITYNNGELVITESITLQKGTDIREGLLSITIDLSANQISGRTPIANQFLRAEYRETQGGVVAFRGSLSDSYFWVVDFCSSGSLFGVEGEFVMIFSDAAGYFPGCRVFASGYVNTTSTPEQCRQSNNYHSNPPDDSAGFSGDVYIEDNGGGCGGTDTSETSDSREGDGSSYGSGGTDCAGDSAGSDRGCEGDASTTDSGCDGGSETCESAPRDWVVTKHSHQGNPLGVLTRWLPELMVLTGISFFRSRNRKNRSEK